MAMLIANTRKMIMSKNTTRARRVPNATNTSSYESCRHCPRHAAALLQRQSFWQPFSQCSEVEDFSRPRLGGRMRPARTSSSSPINRPRFALAQSSHASFLFLAIAVGNAWRKAGHKRLAIPTRRRGAAS